MIFVQRLNDIYNLKKHPMPCLATSDDDEPKLDKATLFSFGRVGRSWGGGARDGAG